MSKIKKYVNRFKVAQANIKILLIPHLVFDIFKIYEYTS